MTTDNPTQTEKLIDRLYAELARLNTESQEFKDTFNYIQTLESKPSIDHELQELEKDLLKAKTEKERAETLNLNKEPVERPWYQPSPDVLVPAVAGFAGVIVIVLFEQFGSVILNSKALNRLPKV